MKWLKAPYAFFFLAFVAISFLWFAQRTTTLQDIANQVSENLNKEIETLQKKLESVYTSPENLADKTALFKFKNDTLVYWTNHTIPVSYNLIENAVQWKLIRNKGFSYLAKSLQTGDSTFTRVIVLQRDYPVQNKYLKTEWNNAIFPTRNYTLLDANATIGVPVYYSNQIVFRISTQDYSLPAKHKLITLGFILLLVSLSLLAFSLKAKIKTDISPGYMVVILCTLVVLRMGLYFFLAEANFTDHILFSPETFASSTINPSLADLLLNLFFLFFLTLFFSSVDFSFLSPKAKYKYTGLDFLYGFVLATLLFVLFYFPVALLQTITHNSAEDFSFSTSIRLSTVRLLALFAWLASAFIALLWFIKVWKIFKTFFLHKQRLLLAGAITFSLINYSNGESYLNCVVPAWIFLFLLDWKKLEFNRERFDFSQFIFLFLFIVVLSVSSSFAIQNLENEKIEKEVDSYVDELKNDRDIFTEYLLQNVVNEIQQDVYIQTRLNSPLLSKEPIVSKIDQAYLSGYLSRYKKEINLFAADGSSYTQSLPMPIMFARYDSAKNGISKENYYLRKSGSLVNGLEYALLIPIFRNQSISGYVSVFLSSLTTAANTSYPEIWIDERWSSLSLSRNVAYAIVKNKHFVTTVGDFKKDVFSENTQSSLAASYSYFSFPWRNSELLVFQVTTGGFYTVFMDACYLIVAALLLVIAYFTFTYLFRKEVRDSISYSSAIQFIINLAFFIPLLCISLYLLFILDKNSKERFEKENESRLQVLTEKLRGIKRDSLLTSQQNLLGETDRVNEYFDLYSEKGVLLFSNKPLLRNNLLPWPLVAQVQYTNTTLAYSERLGRFSFQELFTHIPESDMVISSPVYHSSTAVLGLQSQVLNSVLLVFFILFCLLLWISKLVSDWLIRPFSMLQKSFANTTLSSLNKSLVWTKNDEVALVVHAFNSMLQKLEENKISLEHLKREETWREVAQQVAHEIKNPLTPMKLNLQRMLRNTKDEASKKTLEMLVEQVEVLDAIASSFSNYAKMPKATILATNLNELLEKQIALFDEQIQYKITQQDQFIVLADEKMLKAVMNNLLLNSLQATPDSVETRIQIDIWVKDLKVRVRITDNGKGIPPELQNKLFLPHFTTKSTGSGLGLAFAHKMMEAMQGKIMLEHSDSQGTSFILEFLLYRDEQEVKS
ncbi:MAG: sensor histidine kinase [Chryseotalea sp.]